MIERNYPYLWSLEEDFLRCMRCGKCHSVCPLYERTSRELIAPRGKIALLEAVRDGAMPLDRAFTESMDQCLHCMLCKENCPAGVDWPRLAFAARAESVQGGFFGPIKSFLFRILLKRGRLLPPITTSGAVLIRLLDFILPKSSPWRTALPLPSISLNSIRIFPRPAPKTFLSQFAGFHPAQGKKRGRVVFFVGCATNLVNTTIGEAFVKLYTSLGYDVLVPAEQGCCGFPALGYGDTSTARYRANKLAELLKDIQADALIVPCASGGHMIKEEYPHFLGIDIPLPVYDSVEFLLKVEGVELSRRDGFPPMVFHLPCHLGRGQGLPDLHQKALSRALGKKFLGAALEGDCCGAGGTYHITHYDMTKDMGQAKVRAMEEMGGELMVTSCPGCMMYLDEALIKAGHPPSKHILEVLAG